MKTLSNLSGVKILSNYEQRLIAGGGKCLDNCVGQPQGTLCYGDNHCDCPGECNGFGFCDRY